MGRPRGRVKTSRFEPVRRGLVTGSVKQLPSRQRGVRADHSGLINTVRRLDAPFPFFELTRAGRASQEETARAQADGQGAGTERAVWVFEIH